MYRARPFVASIVLVSLAACGPGGRERPVFKLLSPSRTGITFANTITTNDSVNVQNDVYVYNGAGVAVGDIDNDGLPDIFFAGNMVSSRLYLNKGDMRFEDITKRAGVETSRWATGVTMVDINNDGYLDIYVSVSGPARSKPEQRANELFINNGNRTFTEAAARYGIADTSFTTHAVFLDYDRDGCLDVFLLNNSPADFSRGEVVQNPAMVPDSTMGSYNQLYRNNCNGSFTNVSKEAGILHNAGYGLGVVVGDLNADGWPDIYVSNDGTPNDAAYVNNRDGTFTNKARRYLKHASYAGMGVDIADFNDDGWPDIVQVDMMPHALSGRKRTSGYMTPMRLLRSRSAGIRDDYSVNSLQLSNGVTKDGDIIFSEVGRLAGVAQTDWSWSALFADFDNDGYKDIFIGNGYPKAVNDLDYQTAMFTVRRGKGIDSRRVGLDILDRLPTYAESNYVFRNDGDPSGLGAGLTFTDKSVAWGLAQPSFSYGAAYADLNNDGRLDLVVNNIDAKAFVYENVGGEPNDDAHHWLAVRLEGEAPRQRSAGIGATLVLTAGGRKQDLYATPYRGYMSSVDDRLHFGLGRARRADTLEVTWPDGRHQKLTNIDADRLIVVRQQDATEKHEGDLAPPPTERRVFERVDGSAALAYMHRATALMDYSVQPLIPYQLSQHGPPIAVGDVDGDGLEDVYVGGGSGVAGQLFVQRKNGGFAALGQSQPWAADTAYEDWGALFFDANGDGKPDLYVASGGYRIGPNSRLLQDRLYINHGGGRFARDSAALPVMLTSTAAVRAGDFNGDGRPDLFVGGRLTPRSYPSPTRSYILRNDGGRFTDVTAQVLPELVQPGGMITDAVWIDFDGDGKLDLVTAGEWMPIQFYRNDGKRLVNVTTLTGLPSLRGWWFSLATGDFDNDGRPDFVAGNLGLNYSYTTSRDGKFGVYAADFTGHRTTDIILTQASNGTDYPYAGLASLSQEIYPLGTRYRTYASFASATTVEAFGQAELQKALHYQVDTFAAMYFHNDGNGKFSASPLPNLAQIAPIKSIIPTDVDGDGHLDLIVAGNIYETEPNTPRADAGNGLWLRGDGRGGFSAVRPSESGFLAPLNVDGLALVKTDAGRLVLVANTGDSVQAFRVRPVRSQNP
jgi:enediyne biosynthesis protein E4